MLMRRDGTTHGSGYLFRVHSSTSELQPQEARMFCKMMKTGSDHELPLLFNSLVQNLPIIQKFMDFANRVEKKVRSENLPMHHFYLVQCSRMMAHTYRIFLDLHHAMHDQGSFEAIGQSIDQLLESRKTGCVGMWKDWYRGDKKVNWKVWKQRFLESQGKTKFSWP